MVFIVAGGPSVTDDDVSRLKGRKVIAINSSYEKAPFADFLFFGDTRWWHVHYKKVAAFKGRIVTCSKSSGSDRLLRLIRETPPPGLSSDPGRVTMQRTSLSGAINLAVHLGASRLVILGADMGRAADGRTHHHSPHPWKTRDEPWWENGRKRPGCWVEQMNELRIVAASLRERNIPVINASLVSRIDFWEKKPLAEVLGAAA